MIDIRFAQTVPDTDTVVHPVTAADAGAGRFPADAAAVAAAQRFAGEAGSVAELYAVDGGKAQRVLLAGIGAGGEGGIVPEQLGSTIAARLLTTGAVHAAVDLSGVAADDIATFAARVGLGASLRSWRHDAYRTRQPAKEKPTLTTLTIVGGGAGAEAAWARQQAVAEGVALTRTLVTEPANIVYPESFVARVREALEGSGVGIEVLDEAAMREAGMGALLGVSQGSVREAQLLVMTYDGTGGTADPVAFVGKGVTFDTGGISLKPGAGMEDMKWDMGGAGAVAGAMLALARRKAKAHVIGVCGLVENMPDANAQRPGDVVTSMSGQTIEVINTDAEGRLVLCDAITWVQQRFGVKTIVDLATLTGAMIISLGREYGGIFANSDELADQLTTAARAAGEPLWRMPLGDAYDKLINSDIADMKNVGPREAGSVTAAQFILRFVDQGVRWAHLDIAGMVWAAKPALMHDKGATGYGVRLLDRYVADVLEG